MTFRPPSRTGRTLYAVRTRAKGPVIPEEPAKDVPEPSGEKEVVDVPEEEDDEDDRLRKEEDEKAEQRAKKRGVKRDTDKAQEVKKKKYAVRVEEDFDVEEIMNRILEGHNHLMNLKDVLTSAPRLRDELRARLSRKMGSQRQYKKVDQKCRPVPVLVAEEKEVYYERERELIRQMRENAESMLCRINLETEKALIIGEPGFLTAQEEKLMVDTIRGKHTAYAFNDDERGRLDVDKIPMIRIHTVPHEPWNLRGARYPNPADEEKRIPGTKNRADRLNRVDWDKNHQGVIEDTPPVDGFLDSEENVRLHINSWALTVGKYVTPWRPVWLAPPGHVRRPNLVLKPYIEEDSWGMSGVGWMMELALAGKHELQEDPLRIENGMLQVGKHEKMIGGVYLLTNALLQEEMVRNTVLDQEEEIEPGGGDNVIHEREDDDFEEGEIKEAFRAEEYEGVYLELGMLLSCEIRERDACAIVLKMRPNFLVRDDHLFMRSKRRDPRRVVCGVARQIDIMAALHDGTAGGHKGADTIYVKIHELYYWDDMGQMIDDYCKYCVPCQERSTLRPREPLHPRHATFPIESFLKTWRRQDLETDLTFEELLDLRARQIGVIEDRIEEAASRTADSRTKDKFRWDKMARVRKKPLKVGNIVLLLDTAWGSHAKREGRGRASGNPFGGNSTEDADEDQERGQASSLPGREHRVVLDGVRAACTRVWVGQHQDAKRDELDTPGEQRVGSFLLFVRPHIRPFVRSIVASAKNWGHCKKLLCNYYTLARQASERRGMEKRRREPETEARGTFEQGASPGAQREERRKEHKSHRHERAEGSDGSDAPPQPAQREMDGLMPDAEPDIPHEMHTQELREEPSGDEKELDREVRAARELEIRTQLRKKNLAELHERMQQGKTAEEVEDREALAEEGTKVGELEWRLPAGLTLEHEPAVPQEGPPVEAMRAGEVRPAIRKETVGQQEGHESVGRIMAETEQKVDLRDFQESTMLQEVPVVTDLWDVLGSWVTGSGPEGRVGELGMPADDRATCPASSGVLQQEVTSKISTTPSSVPSLEGDKMSQKKLGKYFYCKRGKHRSDDCPKSLKDEANGL
ncbi:hypothetical protein CBR_g45659 [Chara braunii]|uniref:Integrase zinc-binding domain-containing protein n=1 Tax=Chara braunii TaxID=69332 RepID=A0A388K3G6_CHABU|nr:hypothetical protein CBR_g45659 [Chara braunii]|eukprot:GBG64602.1 hypothetical protein CBR_g45659 [Chara braunii]